MIDTYKKAFIYTYTFFILASLNVNPNNFISESITYNIKILNFFRFIAPSLIVVIFFNLLKNINYKIIFKNNSIISKLIVVFFLVLLIFSLRNNLFAIENLYFILYFNIFAYLYILSNYYTSQTLLRIFIFILFICFSYWVINMFFEIKNLNKNNFNIDLLFNLRDYKIHNYNEQYFLENSNINSNGISRVISIIFLLIFYYELFCKKKKLNYIFLIFLSFLIFSLGSKFAFYSTIFLSIVLIYLNNRNKLKKILFILIIFFWPLFKSYNVFNFSGEKNIMNVKEQQNNIEILKNESRLLNDFNDINNLDNLSYANKIFTGRIDIWKYYLSYKIQRGYFSGEGILADKINFSISASNAFVYSFLVSGVLGSIIYLIICGIFFIKFIKYLISNSKYDLRLIFFLISFFLILRTFIENGFLTYGLDLILLLICLEIIDNKKLNSFKI